ncbi:MAG: hypothetical protein ABDH23_07060 [Endomicrobiia bacterium]
MKNKNPLVKIFIAEFLLFTISFSSFEFSGVKNVGGRVLGFGSAYTAIAEESEGSFINPAGLAQNRIYKEVSLMYTKLFNIPELSYSYLGIATPDKGKGALGINASILGFSSYYSEKIFSLSYARRLVTQPTSELYAGLSLKLLHRLYEDKPDIFSTVYDQDGNVVAQQEKTFVDMNLGYDIGVLYSMKMDKNLLRVGVSYRNNQVDGSNVSNIRTGVAYNLEKKALVSLDYDISEKSISAGGEYALIYRLLDVRVGYQQVSGGSNISLGIGLTLRAWRFDFVYLISQTGLPNTYRIGCVAKF